MNYLLLFLLFTCNSNVNLISNQYFDVYYPGERREIADNVSNYAVNELERISRNLHIQTVEKITIFIMDEEEFNEKYASELPEWGIGFAKPSQRLIILKFPSSFRNPPRLKFIVGHEIAHILIHSKVDVFIPRWFDEGTAIYLSKEPSIIDDLKLFMAVLFRKIIPLSDLEHSFPHSGTRANLAYIESFSAVTLLISEYGPGIINEILSETAETNDFKRGFLFATGVDLNVFMLEWRTWLTKRFTVSAILKPNLLFFLVAILVLLIGIIQKLRRRSRHFDESIED